MFQTGVKRNDNISETVKIQLPEVYYPLDIGGPRKYNHGLTAHVFRSPLPEN